MVEPNSFRFSIDRGGTFTDIYAEVPGEPSFRTLKLLSENPEQYPDAPLEGIHRIIQEVTGKPHIPPQLIEWVRMGTTLATNAFLERKGTRSALVITKGFGDLLKIGKQNRPNIFELKIAKPSPLYECVLEINERVRILPSDKVEVLHAPDTEIIKKQLVDLRQKGIKSLAIVFMHAYVFPDHEKVVKNIAQECGFENISLSSEVLPLIKFVDRGQTTCLDAYLNLSIQKYLESFNKDISPLFIMQSDGGLVEASKVSGCRSLLSGPAGGVVGYAQSVYAECGNRPVIGFDMGGRPQMFHVLAGNMNGVWKMKLPGCLCRCRN